MDKEQIEATIEELRRRIINGIYTNVEEKHELEKQRWLLKKYLAALESELDTFIVQ